MTQGRIRVLVLMAADMLCMAAVWALVVNFYKWIGLASYHATSYWHVWPALFLFIFINAFFRLYHGNPFYPSIPLAPVEEFRRLVGSSVAVHVFVMAVLGFRHESSAISRAVLLVSCAGVALTSQFARDLARLILWKAKIGLIPAVVVGQGRLEEELSKNSHIGFKPVAYKGDNHGIVDFARKRDIKILVSTQDVRLFREEMVTLVKWFQQIEFLPAREIFPSYGARPVLIGLRGGLEMVNQRCLRGLQIEKRLVDLCLSLVIGLLSLPFWVILPVLIRLTSRGPVIYKAERLGRKGRTIHVWKFRTMYADADRRLQALLASDPCLAAEFKESFKLKKDPRVTPLGRILRKTSLDELPQLINVFRGEMALVGPRPIVESEKAYYGSEYEIFSLVRPGITGLWQCLGRSDTSYPRRVALDRFYVLNWNPWMDLWIVLRTIRSVLFMRGAC
jgi:Undecaprenyl-phosphate galactose phosphotransferase WbaP